MALNPSPYEFVLPLSIEHPWFDNWLGAATSQLSVTSSPVIALLLLEILQPELVCTVMELVFCVFTPSIMSTSPPFGHAADVLRSQNAGHVPHVLAGI